MRARRADSHPTAATYTSTGRERGASVTAIRRTDALYIRRIGDPVSCGGSVAIGSGNVFIGG